MSATEFVIAGMAVFIGALVQGSVGFGFGLLVVPVLTWLQPQAVPVTALLLSQVLAGWVFMRERGGADLDAVPLLVIGLAVGSVAALAIVAALSDDQRRVLIGIVLLAATGFSLARPFRASSRWLQAAAGFASGLMATTAAVGGPPLALAYQQAPAATLRPTLAAVFLVETAIALTATTVTGQLNTPSTLLALGLLPLVVLGLALSGRLLQRLPSRSSIRGLVLGFAASASVVTILQGL